MAKYGSNSLVVELDNSGGSLVDISQYVRTINGLDIEALTQESHAFGDSWFEHLATGLKKSADVVLGGFYDDTATTGPNVLMIAIGDTRTLKLTYGSTKTSTVETIIAKYSRMPKVGELTGYETTLRPTGSVAEA